MPLDPAKLKALQKSQQIGGKGTARRKKKVVQRSSGTDDKKLQGTLKKLQLRSIPGVEEVSMIKGDGNVITFNKPKVQAAIQANVFSISGKSEEKHLMEALKTNPELMQQLGHESMPQLQAMLSNDGIKELFEQHAAADAAAGASGEGEEDVPDLEGNFDEVAASE